MQGLPESDGTTSTNYGQTFETSSAGLYVLRCIQHRKPFKTWINYREKPYHQEQKYGTWDDIVSDEGGHTLCVQLKHTKETETEKLNGYLAERATIVANNPDLKLIFVYLATTPDHAIRGKYNKLTEIPDFLHALLTNESCVYHDDSNPQWPTYFCMDQKNVSTETEDIRRALLDCINRNYISNDSLAYVQTKFLDYVRLRYFRLSRGTEPLTHQEMSRELGYLILSRFKVEYKPGSTAKPKSYVNELGKLLGPDASSVVVVNHSKDSQLKEKIWYHLGLHLGKELKQDQLDELWRSGVLHMPVVSGNRDSDRTILKALELSGFQPKVLVLRYREFSIRPKQTLVTLLQNLQASDDYMCVQTDGVEEKFTYVTLEADTLRDHKLHPDAFCSTFKDFFSKKLPAFGFMEAHDVHGYLNNEDMPALFSAIKVPEIDCGVISELIRLGAKVNATILGGHIPISFAVEMDRPDILRLLLEKGANPNPADKYGMTPLFYACNADKTELVRLLVQHGADRDASDVEGTRPLFMAYRNKNFDVMKIILTGFDVPHKANALGDRMLHVAARDGCVQCLECIVECCPDKLRSFLTGDFDGKTPRELAQERGHGDFVVTLDKAMEEIECKK